MHKSAIIFLLGFMVILLPFGPSNIRNANAIAEDEDYVEQYRIMQWIWQMTTTTNLKRVVV